MAETPPEPTSTPAASSPSRIGLIGPTIVGKTTYFSVLDRALRDQDWRVVPHDAQDEESADLLNQIRNYTNQGLFPRKTPARSPDRRLYYRVSRDGYGFELTFYDPPGELFEPGDQREAQLRETRKELFKDMENIGGLLVLLNLDKSPHELMNIWHFSIESFIGHLRRAGRNSMIAHDRLQIRVAVVFTKADLLPWMARHRSPDAMAWLEGREGLRDLAKDIRRDCGEVNVFFSSAVGWNKGRPNIRTVVRPRELGDDQRAGGRLREFQRELIPDPAEGRDSSGAERSPRTMPLFVDPLRIVDETPHRLVEDLRGVVTLPGRHAPGQESGRFLTPWNITRPLLWAAGVPERLQ